MAKGTVTYVEGKNVGINESGEKVGGDGPDKDKLKTEVTVNISKANILIDNVKGYASEIKNGDQIKASGTNNNEIQTVRISRSVAKAEAADVLAKADADAEKIKSEAAAKAEEIKAKDDEKAEEVKEEHKDAKPKKKVFGA